MNRAFLNTSLETFRELVKAEFTAMAFGGETSCEHSRELAKAFGLSDADLTPLNNTQKYISIQRGISETFRLFRVKPVGTTIPTTLVNFELTPNKER